ncbi:response regulator [bacterium]|nr:response regulator [bacterium]
MSFFREKINLALCACIILVFFIFISAILKTLCTPRIMEDFEEHNIPGIITISEIQAEIAKIKIWVLFYLLHGNIEVGGGDLKGIINAEYEYLKLNVVEHLGNETHAVIEDQLVGDRLLNLTNKFMLIANEVMNLKDRGIGIDKLKQKIRNDLLPLFYELNELTTEHKFLHVEEIASTVSSIHRKNKPYFVFIILLSLLSIAGLVLTGFYIKDFQKKILLAKEQENIMAKTKEEAETASSTKSHYLKKISFEARTALNAVLGVSDMILTSHPSWQHREYVEMIKGSSNSLLTFVNNILNFTEIEVKRINIENNPFDLRKILELSASTLAYRAYEKGLKFALWVKQDVPVSLVGDPEKLGMVIFNLGINAINFTETGEIVIICRTESRTNENAQLHFTVSDTGAGIQQEKLDRIFYNLNEHKGTLAYKYRAEGLGLYISKQLVEAMGGRIWAESELNKGSNFHFTARFMIGSKDNSERPEAKLKGFRGAKILVAESNEINRKILIEMLSAWGFNCEGVNKGKAVIQEIEKGSAEGMPYQALLLDSQLPDTPTLKGLKELKEDEKIRRFQIILLNSIGSREDMDRFRELGVAKYLLKPVKQAELIDELYDALNKKAVSISTEKAEDPEKQDKIPQQAGASQDIEAKEDQKAQGYMILLCEDNLVNQKMATMLLDKYGHKVTVAKNGEEGVKLFEEMPFDLVLMDVDMPVMNGLEATMKIREKEKSTGTHLPIIAMTAHAMKEDRQKCLEAGMDDHISKPIKMSDLQDSMNRVMPSLRKKAEYPVAVVGDKSPD